MIVFIVPSLSSCQVKIIQGSGNVIRETRDVFGINSIELEGMGNVILTQGNEEFLTIEADDNLMEYITSEMSGQKLQIKFPKNQTLIPSKTIIFRIGFINLSSLSSSGTVSIESRSINTNRLELLAYGEGAINIRWLTTTELKVITSGSGDIVLAGKVQEQSIELTGVGNYNAPDLQSQIATILNDGLGSAILWVEDVLNVEIKKGAGDVSYFGNPTVNEDLGYNADLNHLGDK